MKKFAALLLLTSMLASCAACGSDAPAKDDTTALPDETTEAETTDDGLVRDNLGDIRFDGETFNIWLYTSHALYTKYDVSEETGDVFDDAIYARNRAVEERLGIKLTYTMENADSSGALQGASCKKIESLILAGDDTFDVYLHVQASSIPQLISNHYFLDWNTIPNVDLTREYWSQGAANDINYGSKIYMMTGAYEYGTLANAHCMIFNKRIFDEAKIDYPYQSVLDGTWTYEKWKQIIADTSRDLNGDTVYDLENDQFGYTGRLWEAPYTFFVGMGGDMLTRDENNEPVNVIQSERNVDIIDRLLEIVRDTEGTHIASTVVEMTDAFASGKIATIHGGLSYIPTYFRDMKDDFGFVPSPKFDEEQRDYHVYVTHGAYMTYIPITNNRLELTGAALEIMAMESYNRVIPAYVDTVLTVKSTRDTESEQMIPFILERASFYDHSLTMLEIPNCINNNVGLATYYAQNQTRVEEHIRTLAETYR